VGVLADTRRERIIDLAIALVAFGLTLGLFAGGGVDAGSHREATREVDALGVLLAALSTLPLVAWRRSPLGVYVVVIVANGVMNVVQYPDGPPFGAAAALFLLATAGPAARPPLRVTGSVVVSLFALHFLSLGLAQGDFPAIELLLGSSLWVAAWFAGERMRLRREQIAELEERAQRAEREAERERRLAAAEERTRIARDLHDSAGHAINVVLVQAGAARVLQERDPAGARRALETIEEVARETLEEIDHLVRALREGASGAEVEPPVGLSALDSLVERQRAAGVGVDLRVRGERRPLPRAVDHAAFRILQEALTNVARHGAGGAEVELVYGDAALELVVANPAEDGVAGVVGHGIIGMRERAALVGGSIEAAARNGSFVVRAVLPYGGGRT
jgi:signal transduction histidine kinase